uniref:Uncharacterized protein n=1 Tax=Trichogramma kaykai TaxID=54128 RepID=A0ABD2VYC6_9HYME
MSTNARQQPNLTVSMSRSKNILARGDIDVRRRGCATKEIKLSRFKLIATIFSEQKYVQPPTNGLTHSFA